MEILSYFKKGLKEEVEPVSEEEILLQEILPNYLEIYDCNRGEIWGWDDDSIFSPVKEEWCILTIMR